MKVEDSPRESKHIDFKGQLDFSLPQDRCEIIKDMIAMANSGGGHILIGVNDDGSLSGLDVTPILTLDPAKIMDQITKYTNEHFSDFEIYEAIRKGQRIAILAIKGTPIPIIFTDAGNYTEGGKTKSAFSKGTVYFRHGAKSEPGNSKDLKNALEQELLRTRKTWLSGFRKVVEAPAGSQVQIITSSVIPSKEPGATPIRFTDDPSAPAYHNIDPNTTHPYRLKEVVEILKEKIKSNRPITQYDVYCVRQVHGTENNAHHYYKPISGSPQYSEEYISWLIKNYNKDPNFFDEARNKCKKTKSSTVSRKS